MHHPDRLRLLMAALYVTSGCLTIDSNMRAGHEALRNADFQAALAQYGLAADRFQSDAPPSKRYALALYYQADAMLTDPMNDEPAEAERLAREALAIWDETVGRRRLSTLAFLSRIAQARKDQYDATGAAELERLSDEIAAENLPPEHELMKARAGGLRFELAVHPDEIERFIQP